MSYYNHASSIAHKLDQWAEPKPLKNYEIEGADAEHRLVELDAAAQPIIASTPKTQRALNRSLDSVRQFLTTMISSGFMRRGSGCDR